MTPSQQRRWGRVPGAFLVVLQQEGGMSMEEKRTSVPKLFGSHVFNDDVMQERLPKPTYKELSRVICPRTCTGLCARPSTRGRTWT